MPEAGYPDVSLEDGHWLAGFVDGEGCFGIYPHSHQERQTSWRAVFSITLRADDRPVLEKIQAVTGVGKVRDRAPSPLSKGTPMVNLQTNNRRDLLRLVRIFDRYPLQSKKAHDFAIWREGVLYLNTLGSHHRRGVMGSVAQDYGPMPEIAARLYVSHRYRPLDTPRLELVPEDKPELQLCLVDGPTTNAAGAGYA